MGRIPHDTGENCCEPLVSSSSTVAGLGLAISVDFPKTDECYKQHFERFADL
jgi:nitrogen-specific signal transduction histidine kinase